MHKRGQITIFIIVGIIVLSSVLLLSYFMQNQKEKIVVQDLLQTDSIKAYVESCLRSTTNEGIVHNGNQGGYFFLPEDATTNLAEDVPFYNTVLSNEEIQLQLGLYIDTMLELCIDTFRPFTEVGYEITEGEVASSVSINPTKVDVILEYPLVVTQGYQTKELHSFRTSTSSEKIQTSVEVAEKIVEVTEQGEVCITCFSHLAIENDLFIGIVPVSDKVTLFEVQHNGEEMYWRFAVKDEE